MQSLKKLLSNLLREGEVFTGKSQIETLPYWPCLVKTARSRFEIYMYPWRLNLNKLLFSYMTFPLDLGGHNQPVGIMGVSFCDNLFPFISQNICSVTSL